VRIDPLFQPNESRRAAGASVTYEPGARTAWHTHPLGQTLIVMAGCGRGNAWVGRWRRFGRGIGLVCVGGEALARRISDDGDDAYCQSGAVRWEGGGRDGEGER
jgi:hypothetical protein